MRVQDLMTTAPAICLPHDALHRAAALMWEHDCGCLPVCTPGTRQVEGIITDRDICMAAYIRRQPLMDITVAEAMRRPVRVCAPTDSLAQVQQIMVEAKIRRLPVVDGEGNLAGIISLTDLAHEARRQQTRQTRDLTGHDVTVTLASICEARRGPAG